MTIRALIAAVLVVAAPLAAGAVTVGGTLVQANTDIAGAPGGVVGEGELTTNAGDGAVAEAWKFTALDALRLSGTGTVNGVPAFIQPIAVSYSSDGAASGVFQSAIFGPVFGDTQGFVLPALTLSAGQTVFVLLQYAGATEDAANIDFRMRTQPAPVPTPPAGALLIAGLIGLGLLRRRALG